MVRRANLEVDGIVVSLGRVDRDAYWEFRGKVSHGTVFHYFALDANDEKPPRWWFLLHVPKELRKGAYLLLQALDYPRAKEWTPVGRTVINFAKATMPDYRGNVYAKIRLADPVTPRKYENVARAHKNFLPDYLGSFKLRPKSAVATTRGGDAESLVAVIPREDHTTMIRLFFATKAWPLRGGLPAATRKALVRVES